MKIALIHRAAPHRLNDPHRWDRGYFAALRELGLEVEERPTDAIGDLSSFDYVYLWGVNQPAWGLPAAIEIAQQGARLITIPIWWHPDALNNYLGVPTDPSYLNAVATIMNLSESLHVRTHSEALECWKVAPGASCFVLRTGYYELDVPAQPADDPGYVVSVADIFNRKNQLNLARACALLGVRLVCVGPTLDQGYANRVVTTGAEWVGQKPHGEALEILARARVYANPSFYDNVALSSQEACTLGVPAVLSVQGCEVEYFGLDGDDYAGSCSPEYCDPSNVADIARAIKRAWDKPRGSWSVMDTWREVAEDGLMWMESK